MTADHSVAWRRRIQKVFGGAQAGTIRQTVLVAVQRTKRKKALVNVNPAVVLRGVT